MHTGLDDAYTFSWQLTPVSCLTSAEHRCLGKASRPVWKVACDPLSEAWSISGRCVLSTSVGLHATYGSSLHGVLRNTGRSSSRYMPARTPPVPPAPPESPDDVT